MDFRDHISNKTGTEGEIHATKLQQHGTLVCLVQSYFVSTCSPDVLSAIWKEGGVNRWCSKQLWSFIASSQTSAVLASEDIFTKLRINKKTRTHTGGRRSTQNKLHGERREQAL